MKFFISNDLEPAWKSESGCQHEVFADYHIYFINEYARDFSVTRQDNEIGVLIGTILTEKNVSLEQSLLDIVKNGNIYSYDGCYVFFIIQKDGGITFYSDREGLIPVYYSNRKNKITITSQCEDLIQPNPSDIDYSSLYDFMRYGMMIGHHTISKYVNYLQGGTRLSLDKNGFSIKKMRYFRHNDCMEEFNVEEYAYQIKDAYHNALRKRLSEPLSNTAVLLSGGMDSRFVIASINEAFHSSEANCFFWGMPYCDEMHIAQTVAGLKGNPFTEIRLTPENHLSKTFEYLLYTGLSDMAPQSFVIDAINSVKQKGMTSFVTGSFIECHIGGTFLTRDAIYTKKNLSDFLPENMNRVKCEVFSDDDLVSLFGKKNYHDMFDGRKDNLAIEAGKYDGIQVKDIIQSFIIDNRDKRLVLNREWVPGRYLRYINPNFDRDFLELASFIPPEWRLNRRFYRELFVTCYPEYARIINNNYRVPISAATEIWKLASENLAEYEQIIASAQKADHGKNIFYLTRYYSDFDGYSRYDKNWRHFIESNIFNGFLKNMLDLKYIKSEYDKHLCASINMRKKLVLLASIGCYYNSRLGGM